ncbi:glycoside hydrolase family 43 protein [Stenotrophomonas tumulicola]|uniref:Glycoside hydrolase family 43 protein n=1 Tax=Stenotrophomonas tumulicola TaxID=1685415 RepID=A0A7W3IGT9_9GAMM|nr:glycoside hydrolase family 43 protein [Stenotrophomonas tumulicola]MBA8681142.1 glycoside hydrolase family 43 protein [Stenotrophomonas tumulicola]
MRRGQGRACAWWLVALLLAVGAQGAAGQGAAPIAAADAGALRPTVFDWFEYRGEDEAFASTLPEGHFRNPVLAGFNADPSVVAANGRFYLVNSSFGYFPAIPVHESTDLVHWRQIGHVIDRPGLLDFDGLGVSRGIFAPAIAFHAGRFHVVGTAVDSGGNFIASATDPAGPWSDPTWLPDVAGIDPSLFFDDDGQAYLLNNDAPAGPARYDGHRAVWIRRIDVDAGRTQGPATVLVDGGVDPAANPIWIEGPHLYKRDGWYVLSAAEGGTGPQHSQVVLRSRHVLGPYEAFPGNPILTQRDLPAGRRLPIINAGHADLVQGPDGSWWALFLASRTYGQRHYNTGRETFLLPVQWQDGWPLVLPPGAAIPYALPAPGFARGPVQQAPNSGNFTWRDGFDARTLRHEWSFLRVPTQDWVDLHSRPGHLLLRPRREDLSSLRNPSFLARRQQHLRFDASIALQLPARGASAGLAVFQNERHWYYLGVRRQRQGDELFLEKRDGDGPAVVVARQPLPPGRQAIVLTVAADGARYRFGHHDAHGHDVLLSEADGRVLSTDHAGGFVGATLGPHTRDERTP